MRRLCGEGSCSYLGRSRLAPERATRRKRSEKSAQAVVAGGDPVEGPNEKESHATCCLVTHGIRSPVNRGERWTREVKPSVWPSAMKRHRRGMHKRTQGPTTCLCRRWPERTWFERGNA